MDFTRYTSSMLFFSSIRRYAVAWSSEREGILDELRDRTSSDRGWGEGLLRQCRKRGPRERERRSSHELDSLHYRCSVAIDDKAENHLASHRAVTFLFLRELWTRIL